MSIFKAYDIRGITPDEIDSETMERITHAFALYLQQQNDSQNNQYSVVVGRDNRITSESLAKTAISALQQSGSDVIDIGLASTPYFYYVCAAQKAWAGMMITASHNPPQYNGCKLVGSAAQSIGADSGLALIQSFFKKKNRPTAKKAGSATTLDVLDQYIKESIALGGGTHAMSPLVVVVDTGNGVSALMCKALFQKLPCLLIPLFFELDGTFPNHLPNPLEEKNTAALRKTVLEKKADLGIAMDADGDRVIFIDENGEAISSDLITALLAKETLSRVGGAKILYDLRSSRVVKETILANGGVPGITRVGHAFIKEQMRRENAIFAGELSGHFYYQFGELGYFEASLATIVQVCNIISREKKSLSQILSPYKKYYSTGEVNFEVADKKTLLEKLEKYFSDAVSIQKLDGITLEYQDWWCNIRPSNTENLLRLVLEAKTKEIKDQKYLEIQKLIRETSHE